MTISTNKNNNKIVEINRLSVYTGNACSNCTCFHSQTVNKIFKWNFFDEYFTNEQVELSSEIPTYFCSNNNLRWCRAEDLNEAREISKKEYLSLQDLKEVRTVNDAPKECLHF